MGTRKRAATAMRLQKAMHILKHLIITGIGKGQKKNSYIPPYQ